MSERVTDERIAELERDIGLIKHRLPGFVVEILQALRTEREKAQELQTNYSELLMSVVRTHPNESRHETAKRYIVESEKIPCNPAKEEKP